MKQKYIEFIEKAPRSKYFFNREEELGLIMEKIESKDYNFIVISGMPGIGKSALAAEVIFKYKGKKHVFWYPCHEWDSLRSVTTSLSKFLARMGKARLGLYLNSQKILDINEIAKFIAEELENTNTLLVFDDFHKLHKEVAPLFSMLVELLEKINGIEIIALGWRMPLFYDRRDVRVKKIVAEIPLKGLGEESSKKLLKTRNIKMDDAKFKEIYSATQGHPLFLQLITQDAKKILTGDVKKYMQEEIYSKLPKEDKTILNIISVFRYPVSADALLLEKLPREVLDHLVERDLVEETTFSTFTLHDITREFIYPRILEAEKKIYHERAGNYYLEKGDEESLLEAIYHFLKATDQRKAVKIVIDKGGSLINKGYLKEFGTMLKDIVKEQVSAQEWAEILTFKGDILDLTGEWDNALEHYNRCLSLAEKIGNKLKVAELHRKIGWIKEKRNEWDIAIENYGCALKMSEESDDAYGVASANRCLGKIYWRKGKYDKSIEYFNKSMEYAEEIKDLSLIALSYLRLGTVYDEKGETDKAIKYLEKSIEIAEKIGDVKGRADAYNNIGEVYRKKGELARALQYYEKQIKLAEKVGYVRGLGYGLKNAGECYAKKNQLEKAIEYCDKALKIFERLNEKYMIGSVYSKYGIIYRFKKDWERAIKYFNDSIRITEALSMPYDLGERYYEQSLMYNDKGDKREALLCLKKAKEIFEKLDAKQWLKKVEEGLAQAK